MIASASENPMSAIVGVIVRGPTNLINSPIIPERPRKTWIEEATISPPEACYGVIIINSIFHSHPNTVAQTFLPQARVVFELS